MPIQDLIQLRRGTEEQWAAANPVLASGEPGVITDRAIVVYGDGQTPALDLPRPARGGGGGDGTIKGLYTPEMFGARGGTADDTIPVQDAFAAAIANGGEVYLTDRYYIPGGITIDGPVLARGANGVLTDATGSFQTGLWTDDATTNAITVNSPSVVLRDFVISNHSGSKPTSAVGIDVWWGYFLLVENMTVVAYYDNIKVTNSWFYQIVGSRFFDAVRYDCLLTNSTHGDVGGGVVFYSSFATYRTTRKADAHLRWESGGGIRIYGNKMNGRSERDTTDRQTHKPYVGIDIAARSATVDLLIAGNSIENIDGPAIWIRQAAPSGRLRNIMLQNNQTQACHYGVLADPAEMGQMREVLIDGNVFDTTLYGGLRLNNLLNTQIGPNAYLGRTHYLSEWRAAVELGPGMERVQYSPMQSVEPMSVDFENGGGRNFTLFRSDVDSTGAISLDYVEHVYHREFSATAEPTALWRVGGTPNGGGVLTLDLYGRGPDGPCTRRIVRAWTVSDSGEMTLTPVGTDVEAGTGLTVVLDVATYPGEVQVRVTADGTVTGRARLQADGMVSAVRRGEPTNNLV